MRKANNYRYLVGDTGQPDVLLKLDYSLCGFSPVHGNKIAVFDVYLDESGTHSDRGLVVAGYVGDVNKWADFAVAWGAILREYDLPYFHMQTFRSGQGRAYRHLSRRRKDDLLRRLVECIQEAAVVGVAAMMRPQEYRCLTTPEFRSFYGSSYSVCVGLCVSGALQSLPELRSSSERVGVFLEEGHKNVGQALEVIRDFKKRTDPVDLSDVDEVYWGAIGVPYAEPPTMEGLSRRFGYKIGAIGQGSKRDMLPLQAADLLAYCYYSQCSVKGERFCTEIINTIDQRVPHYVCPIEEGTIRQMVATASEDQKAERAFREDSHKLVRYLRGVGMDAKKTPSGVSVRGSLSQMRRLMLQWKATRQ